MTRCIEGTPQNKNRAVGFNNAMKEVILKAGSKLSPYFRTTEFSDLNLE
jgi:hypothetical protein